MRDIYSELPNVYPGYKVLRELREKINRWNRKKRCDNYCRIRRGVKNGKKGERGKALLKECLMEILEYDKNLVTDEGVNVEINDGKLCYFLPKDGPNTYCAEILNIRQTGKDKYKIITTEGEVVVRRLTPEEIIEDIKRMRNELKEHQRKNREEEDIFKIQQRLDEAVKRMLREQIEIERHVIEALYFSRGPDPESLKRTG